MADLEALRALAAGVAVDRTLSVVVGPPGCGWSIHTHTGCIQVDPRDLDTLPDAQLFGLISHEAAHAAVTRYPWLVPRSVLTQPGVGMLLNSLEDCRIEAWLMARLPGTQPWIAAYNDRLLPADGRALSQMSPFMQYALGLVHEWWHGERPEGLDAEVVEVLRKTQHARNAVVAAAPPIHPDTARTSRYARSRVAQIFLRHDGVHPLDGFEQEVRLSAARAWAVIWSDILPAVRPLIARTRAAEAKAQEAAFLDRFGTLNRSVALAPPPQEPLAPIDAALQSQSLRPPVNDTWEQARREVLPLVDPLVDTLNRVLRPRSLPRWVSGHATGQRLDLRAVMRHEARPEPDTLWQRKTLPRKSDPCFGLLIDLSGSMRGDPIHWGFRGTVLLAEVLARLDLPFAIWGFQDAPIPFKDFDQSLASAQPRLSSLPAEVSGTRKGGHNRPDHNWDGPVLEAVRTAMVARGARHPVLIVVSDGAPSGPADPAGALHRAVASVSQDLDLVGVGLGPGTAHVRDFYPRAIAEVPLPAFPAALGRCIQEAVGDA